MGLSEKQVPPPKKQRIMDNHQFSNTQIAMSGYAPFSNKRNQTHIHGFAGNKHDAIIVIILLLCRAHVFGWMCSIHGS
jgi:hypothetical protein